MIISCVVAFRQTDMKKIIAYSSIAHMNIVVLSLMSLNLNAMLGGFSYMITHAFTSTALFFCVGILYDRYGTRDLMNFGGLFYKYPLFSFFFFVFNLANAGFPFFYSFIAELVSFANLNISNFFVVFISSFTIFFSVIYSF
jgi:NADH-quinone oxidoreductase subunit M